MCFMEERKLYGTKELFKSEVIERVILEAAEQLEQELHTLYWGMDTVWHKTMLEKYPRKRKAISVDELRKRYSKKI